MIFTNTTDASKNEPKAASSYPKISDRSPTKEEAEKSILLATYDLLQDLHNDKVKTSPTCIKDRFAYYFNTHVRVAIVPRPDLKGYREAMKMNWNEFTSYVVSAARYVCYNSGGNSGDVSTYARKMYYAGIEGVEECTGCSHNKKPVYKYFNDMYLHEIYVGSVNRAVTEMVKGCDSKIKDATITTKVKAENLGNPVDPKVQAEIEKMRQRRTQKPVNKTPTPASPSPSPIATVIQSKSPMVSAPAK